ncbi:tetratricopeptide repeat protein [Accumulibacter sp.]|uniref:O-linked N-acetylglucosamine transferase, SPINDLY family protein n=1 Tax=Accumulibacter sp. TaxID=2053492 RepID=UPI0025E66D58|nr:tetratricopeptide repeat protein [Accumulibacter sp.]MCM8595889.1 tetratricopeptide repeat protein [Accumulibacter sp.]MCM8625678.1 tetratricopeptide repeat protein [Accumulibacter sp.]MDS4050038.1 tetratricopeptide repeat protein [Accumulibacter sp.]
MSPELIALMRLVEAERHVEVEAAARRIIGAHPAAHPLALKALGFALIGQGRFDDALPIVRMSAERNAHDPEAHNNLGIVLSSLMRWHESLASFERAIALKPDDPEVLKNHGVALSRMHKWNEAVPFFLRAIECHPGDYVEAIAQLANVLLAANRNDEASVCLNELWKNDPENAGILSQLLCASLKRCEWDELTDRLATLRALSDGYRKVADNPFVVLSFPGATAEEQQWVAANHCRGSIPESVLDAPRVPAECARSVEDAPRRLRIGYLSGDYRNHPVGLIIPQVIELHDRSRVEVFGFSTGADDRSEIRERLRLAFDHFVDLAECSVSETARRIRSDAIDILVDLSGWTADGRPEALALRCAPVQVNWLGYAGTIGHPKLADYLLGDPVVTPHEDQAYYTETLAHLPHCYLPADTTVHLEAPPSRLDAGLPESGFVFCSFNNSYKFNPAVFDLWCRLLSETPGSILWLSQPGGSAGERLQKEVAARGVAPARLIFAPRVESRIDHLSRLQLADLALDPFPYNSHSTGIDVLWAGVPMVSLLGDTFPGRVGASLLRTVGLSELVARSPDDYCELALALVRDPDRLRELRARLAAGRKHSALFDMPNFVRSLEDVYSRMWQGLVTGKMAVLV